MIKPQLSIIIPVYNVELKLEKCVKSILNQSFQDFEIFLINDGSTDKSVQLCNELAETDCRIRVIHKENGGVSQTRNVGLEIANGKYIGWVDGDDWIETDMYALLVQEAESKEADMVWCNYYIDHIDNSYIVSQDINESVQSFVQALFDLRVEGMLWNKIMRREIFVKENLRFLDGQNMAEDKNMLIKFLLCSTRIGYVNKPLYHYLQDNPISYTRDISSKRVYEEISNAQDAIDYINQSDIYISNQLLMKFQLHAKRRLLYSKNIDDIKNWRLFLKESNWSILRSKDFQFRHKLLAICSIFKFNVLLKLWVAIKSN